MTCFCIYQISKTKVAILLLPKSMWTILRPCLSFSRFPQFCRRPPNHLFLKSVPVESFVQLSFVVYQMPRKTLALARWINQMCLRASVFSTAFLFKHASVIEVMCTALNRRVQNATGVHPAQQ